MKPSYGKLTILCTEGNQGGIYRLFVENSVGKAEAEFNVTIIAPPSPPPNLRVTEISTDYAVLAWDASESDGGSPILHYKLERRDMKRTTYVNCGETDPKTLTLKVPKLVEGNEYQFRVCAENDIGESEWTDLPEAVTAKHPFGKHCLIERIST